VIECPPERVGWGAGPVHCPHFSLSLAPPLPPRGLATLWRMAQGNPWEPQIVRTPSPSEGMELDQAATTQGTGGTTQGTRGTTQGTRGTKQGTRGPTRT